MKASRSIALLGLLVGLFSLSSISFGEALDHTFRGATLGLPLLKEGYVEIPNSSTAKMLYGDLVKTYMKKDEKSTMGDSTLLDTVRYQTYQDTLFAISAPVKKCNILSLVELYEAKYGNRQIKSTKYGEDETSTSFWSDDTIKISISHTLIHYRGRTSTSTMIFYSYIGFEDRITAKKRELLLKSSKSDF